MIALLWSQQILLGRKTLHQVPAQLTIRVKHALRESGYSTEINPFT